jgi:hypothetical protein
VQRAAANVREPRLPSVPRDEFAFEFEAVGSFLKLGKERP